MTKRERVVRARKGGEARAVNLTPERRREIAQAAARTRWDVNRAENMCQQNGTMEAAA